MINRMNNLSIRNKLRLFTLSTSLLLTVFLLASVWVSTSRAVKQDVEGEVDEAVQQFNLAEQARLKENLQAGEDVAALPQALKILASGDKGAFCAWGAGLLDRSGLSAEHKALDENMTKLDLVALLGPDDKLIGIASHRENPCESLNGKIPFPTPKNRAAAELTDWESHDEHMYEVVQTPIADSTGRYAGRSVVGFEVNKQLADRIVDHAGNEADKAGGRILEVVLWHMEGANPHILGLSGTDISLPFVSSALAKHSERPSAQAVVFYSGGYGFVTEPFGKRSIAFNNPERLRITVIQNTGPKLAVFHSLERFMVLLAAIAMLLGVFFGSFFARPIANPLVGLASAAESVADGNLDHANSMLSNNERAGATDEIGKLERSFMRMVRGLKERLAMSTFLSQATYQHICSDALDGAGANVAVRTSLAVMFSDIRGFTKFSETESPETVIALLNEVLSIQAKIVERRGGDINKFIGDAVFAWFAGDDRCKRAIAASTEMIAALDARFAGRPGTQVGVGIHLGELVVGSVGSQDRKDYTAIGSVVNKAARLCSHAKEGQVLVSAEVAVELNDPSALTALQPILLKGIAEPVHIFQANRAVTTGAPR
jgi:class 3 adenylate cyclase